jgi:anti-sigma28 factor (negative regulator of flagellin synthesis)
MAAISDDSWISDPPALNTGMLDEIKAAVREGRFVIDERVIARALAEDALR